MEYKYTEEHYITIVKEISRLSAMMFQGLNPDEVKASAYIINCLSAVLAHVLTIDDFHERMAPSPEHVREYYYKLLF
jgi:hypothetical protein